MSSIEALIGGTCSGMIGTGTPFWMGLLSASSGLAWARGVAAEMLCVYAGLTQADAARTLGMGSGAAVCIRRKALAEQRSTERKLDRLVRGLEKELDRRLTGL